MFHSKLISIRRYVALWVIAIIPWLANDAIAEQMSSVDRLRICLEVEDYPPYFFRAKNDSQSSERIGILLEVIDQCAQSAGVEVEYLSKPWRRCLADVRGNRVDAIAPVIWSQARQEWGKFPLDGNNRLMTEAALLSVDYPVFTHRNSTLKWDGERFTGIRYGVAAPLGHVAHRRLKHMGVLPASAFTVVDGLTMVSRGFLDGFVAEAMSGRFIAKNHGYDNLIVEAESVFLSTELYLVFSDAYVDSHPEVVDQMWGSLIRNGDEWRKASLRYYGLSE